ncbi:hypothetical protein PIB30_042438 [Stylosanthes scabra]|uniref:Uncharacterized protein n=1 Tax=Stylosanthes scabra TaxID=79078 RepID=A0ABU6SFH6_9FABA|nr:hypothetical protein [Stylosanthes scabra]
MGLGSFSLGVENRGSQLTVSCGRAVHDAVARSTRIAALTSHLRGRTGIGRMYPETLPGTREGFFTLCLCAIFQPYSRAHLPFTSISELAVFQISSGFAPWFYVMPRIKQTAIVVDEDPTDDSDNVRSGHTSDSD